MLDKDFKEINDKLIKIGYSISWLNYGIITIDLLNEQIKEFENQKDNSKEHYRFQTLENYLKNKKNLSDKQLSQLLEILLLDDDKVMSSSVGVSLFNYINLSKSQFDYLCSKIELFGEWTLKNIARQKLLRKLKTENLTEELFNKCIAEGDNVVHEYLLKISNINQLERIILSGKNKKIKNLALEKFKKLNSNKNCG